MSRRVVRFGKFRAFLAGGIVLGVGAAVTLAAWSDSEIATGTFAAGVFNLEGSATDGVAFADHATNPGAALAFALNAAALSPGSVVFAPFALRLAAGTTNDAVVTVTTAGTTGAVTGLTYELLQVPTWACASATTGTSLVPAGSAVGTTPAATTFGLTAGTPATNAGSAVDLCFKVSAGAGLTQGQTGTVTWQFSAASQS